MRVPHTIPPHVFEAYRCSEETILLPCELSRTLRAENEAWDESGVPADLKTQALRVIAANWRRRPLLDELPTSADRDYLLEILDLDLPFEFAIGRIPYEHYWQRAAEARWKFNDPANHGDSWRRLYCDRHLAEYLEGLDPGYFNAAECERLLGLVSEHVRTLKIRQMLPLRIPLMLKAPNPPTAENYDEEEADESLKPQPLREPEVHHIPMDAILNRLPLLEEIHINIGMITSTDGSEWQDFEFSIEDSIKIGRGVKNLKYLTKFSLTRSYLDRPRAAAILHGLAVNMSVVEIDFSHCKLGDDGARAIGAFLMLRRAGRRPGCLRTLRLTNNGIGPKGVAGIIHGMLAYLDVPEDVDEESDSKIRELDLRLNPLGDEGALHVAAMLLRYGNLEYLNVSACNVNGDGGLAMAEVLSSGCTKFSKLRIDCSNNNFGPIVGEAFEIVAKACVAVCELDARMCGFGKESEYSIAESVNRITLAPAYNLFQQKSGEGEGAGEGGKAGGELRQFPGLGRSNPPGALGVRRLPAAPRERRPAAGHELRNDYSDPRFGDQRQPGGQRGERRIVRWSRAGGSTVTGSFTYCSCLNTLVNASAVYILEVL